jgi:beta-glucoside operon transcriptional antiterminator
MVIKRIINNNVVIAQADSGQELILRGKGIGFGKTTGQDVAETLVEKRYYAGQNEYADQLFETLGSLPESYFIAVDEIMELAEKRLDINFSSTIYVSLLDHINFSVTRYKKGFLLKNNFLWEIRRYYEDEFAVGLLALDIIKKHLGIQFDENEVAFLAMHLVNARQERQDLTETLEMTETISECIKLITYFYEIDLDENSFNYKRFIIHLQFLIQRICMKEVLTGTTDEFLYTQVTSAYPKAFQCSGMIEELIHTKYQTHLSKDEITFLTIHINRVAERKV